MVCTKVLNGSPPPWRKLGTSSNIAKYIMSYWRRDMTVLRQKTEAHNPFFLSYLRPTPSPLYNNADFRILNHRQIRPNFILAQIFFCFPLLLSWLSILSSLCCPSWYRKAIVGKDCCIGRENDEGKREEWKMEPIKFIILSNQLLLFLVYVRGFLAVFEMRRLSSSAFAYHGKKSLFFSGLMLGFWWPRRVGFLYLVVRCPFVVLLNTVLWLLPLFVCFMQLRNVHEWEIYSIYHD